MQVTSLAYWPVSPKPLSPVNLNFAGKVHSLGPVSVDFDLSAVCHVYESFSFAWKKYSFFISTSESLAFQSSCLSIHL